MRRLRRVGHQRWLLLPPSTGYAAWSCATGQPPESCSRSWVLTGPSADSTFMSPTAASCSVAMGLPFRSLVDGALDLGRAGGAQAPVGDLGLVDHEAVVVVRGQAGHLADGAVDVDDGATGPADEMVVVVA